MNGIVEISKNRDISKDWVQVSLEELDNTALLPNNYTMNKYILILNDKKIIKSYNYILFKLEMK